MTVASAPAREVGSAGVTAVTYRPGGPEQYLAESYEETPELVFPNSSLVYDRMRRTDGQHAAVLRAATLPILRTAWRLRGDDVRPEVMTFVESELGLDEPDGRRRRRREGVVWRDHLRLALLMLPFGFAPFEQVYEVGPPSPGQEGLGLSEVAHLRKLAPRLPRTLTEAPRVGRDGGLAGIIQNAPGAPADRTTNTMAGQVFIPEDRLVVYVNEREGADWTGSSILRASYKHWMIKDGLIRLGPIVAERNGMGVPIVRYDPETGNETKALAIARNLRAGIEAGAAIPSTMSVELLGVTGSLRDELPLIRYHDEAAGRAALAMFLNLGHDNGARSLGETFVDYFVMSLDSVSDQIADTCSEHVIRDLVELNFGPDETYPRIEAASISAESTPTADALRSLADAGLLGSVDPSLVDEVRRRYGLPALPPIVEGDVEDVTGSPFTEVGLPALVEAGILSEDEARRLLGLSGPAPPRPDPVAPGATLSAGDDPIIDRLAALTDRVAALRQTPR